MSFYRAARVRIWIATVIGGVVYLTVHFLIFDDDVQWRGIKEFLSEGRAHIVHVAPVVIAFVALLVKDRLERRRYGRTGTTPDSRRDD